MTPQSGPERDENAASFADDAEGQSSNILVEFWHFLLDNKKWWLLPIIVMLLLVAVFIILGSTAAAPFIYTLF